jgi:hypothetical protein
VAQPPGVWTLNFHQPAAQSDAVRTSP